MTFKDMAEFEKWKNAEERMTKSWYVKQRADRKTKHCTKSWLRCNRTGTFVSKSTGKRAMKSQGSSKTGCSCPAFITTRKCHATGEVQAEFCLKHVGHRQENAFNRISKEMRTTIAAKLSQGVSMNSVMDYIRDSMCGPLNRDHLITRADLHNIKQQYNINCMQKASADADSVLYWVQEMQCEEFDPVLCFKRQGEKSDYNGVEEKDFLLGFQTQFQKEMFEEHANKLICVDATHGTTAYDFQLVTVLVVDDYNEGIPVAWLISNKETTDALKVFFSSLRERCGDIRTEIFMSDDAEAYY